MSVSIRPCVPGQDDAARLEIYNLARAEDDDFVPDTLEDVRRWDRSPDAPHRHRFIAEFDGKPGGMVVAFVAPKMAGKKGFVFGPNVIPEYRRRGVGTALVRAALSDLRGRGMEQAETHERDRDPANAFLASLGFKPARAFSRMRRGLSDLPAPSPLPPPQGGGNRREGVERRDVQTETGSEPGPIEVVLVEPTDENLAVVVGIENEAFQEHYNYRPVSLEQLRFYQQAITDEGSVGRVSLARVEGRPVGYLVYGYEPRTFEHVKKKRGGLWDLAVLKPFRHQGVATALLTAAMHDLAADGMEEAELYVEDLNVTGVRRLYERLGFTLAYRDLTHIRDLAVPEVS